MSETYFLSAPRPAYSGAQRFKFLTEQVDRIARTRYALWPPDLHELSWSVYDFQDHRTLARGATPEQAVDAGLELCGVTDSRMRANSDVRLAC